jgi:hypothetical protein
MSGFCSHHRHHDSECKLCNTSIQEIFPDYERQVKIAEEAGEVECACGFLFYKTTPTCPLCESWTWLDGGHQIIWPFHIRDHPGFDNKNFIGVFEYVD